MIKKLLILLTGILLITCCVWAQNDSNVMINDVKFEIPSEYQGGNVDNDRYELEYLFSIQCIDKNIPKHIGLWACENDYSENLTISNHPVRHYCQYNSFVKDNQSHAYFASGHSIYEIVWKGNEITQNIKNMIKNTPPSQINESTFNHVLDKSIDIYKTDRINQLNKDSEYNFLESKYKSKIQSKTDNEDTQLKEILLTYYT